MKEWDQAIVLRISPEVAAAKEFAVVVIKDGDTIEKVIIRGDGIVDELAVEDPVGMGSILLVVCKSCNNFASSSRAIYDQLTGSNTSIQLKPELGICKVLGDKLLKYGISYIDERGVIQYGESQ